MKSAEVRRTFLSYFEERGHAIVPSASLVPAGDPTLLFVNAGMVPFKDVFLGKEKRSYTRAASVQKCLRVSGKHNDLEEVGPSSHHHTFFEMLGNFSFGDYFKEEALAYSWEFLTKVLGLPGERLHPTVFEEDDESAQIWSRLTGRPVASIVRLGPEDNFWAMGDTGPCGPNSEIMYDRTGKCLRDGSDCPVTHDCDRWWELWNNVFMQYDRAPDGTLTPLAQAGVDTGMGFERLCAVLQGVASSYETDLFAPLIEQAAQLANVDYSKASAEQQTAMRILADHARATAFLIADGVMPSNARRGYILRKIIRRAVYFARNRLGWNVKYLDPMVHRVVQQMSDAYPELHKSAELIRSLASEEEQKFSETLGKGISILNDVGLFAQSFKTNLPDAARASNTPDQPVPLEFLGLYGDEPIVIGGSRRGVLEAFLKPYKELLGPSYPFERPENLQLAIDRDFAITGETEFILWDTYGFPPELTEQSGRENGLSVEADARPQFERLMEEQRERSRRAHGQALLEAISHLAPTRFVGYDTLTAKAKVLALVVSEVPAETAREGDAIEVFLDTSPFYGEGGGQVGDTGRIVGAEGEVEVEAVRRLASTVTYTAATDTLVLDRRSALSPRDVYAHAGRVVKGRIARGDEIHAEVDELARRATMRNHTATHLLHKALRVVLGPQAKQAGSLVAPDHLRFDFVHGKPLSEDELRDVERIVREQIVLDRAVRTDVLPVQEALASGADAMFDEKYGEEARVVSVAGGDALRPGSGQVFSRELCGGTHCRATGEIGAFFIVDQRSVGAGVRRVEAVTGFGAFEYADARRRVIDQLSREYNVPAQELPGRLRALQERAKEAPKTAAALPDPAEVLGRADQRNGSYVVVDWLDNADADVLRQFGDALRGKAASAAIVLGSASEDKLNVVVMLTSDLVEKGMHAGKLAQQIGKELGGGGGGRPDVATAGGTPVSKETFVSKARPLVDSTAP